MSPYNGVMVLAGVYRPQHIQTTLRMAGATPAPEPSGFNGRWTLNTGRDFYRGDGPRMERERAAPGKLFISPLGKELSVRSDGVYLDGERRSRVDLGPDPQAVINLEGHWAASGNGKVAHNGDVYNSSGMDRLAINAKGQLLMYGENGIAVDGQVVQSGFRALAPGRNPQGHLNDQGDVLVTGESMAVFNGERHRLRGLGNGFDSALDQQGRWVIAATDKIYVNGQEVRCQGMRLRLGDQPRVAMSETGSWIAAGAKELVLNGKPIRDKLGTRIRLGDGAQVAMNAQGHWLAAGPKGIVVNGKIQRDSHGVKLRTKAPLRIAMNSKGDWLVAGPDRIVHNGQLVRVGGVPVRPGEGVQLSLDDDGGWMVAGEKTLLVDGRPLRRGGLDLRPGPGFELTASPRLTERAALDIVIGEESIDTVDLEFEEDGIVIGDTWLDLG